MIEKLPKKWQKFDDLLILPANIEYKLDLVSLAEKFKVTRIAQQNFIIDDQIRTPGAKLLYGNGTHVIQKENGISYQFDFTKSMFSRGNISEKIRFSKFEVSNDVIIDMFCGIGYWVLQLSRKKPPKRVFCVDINPNQTETLEKNLILNKRDLKRFEIITTDCLKIELPEKVNRVFLGLIPCCCFALEKAVQLLDKSRNAFLHIHHNFTDTAKVNADKNGTSLIDSNCCEQQRISKTIFSKPDIEFIHNISDENLKELVERLAERLQSYSAISSIQLLYSSKVKSYAPHIYHYVFDFELSF